MGNPIAPSMADVCMNWVLEQKSVFNPQPRVMLRFVDGLYVSGLYVSKSKINSVVAL